MHRQRGSFQYNACSLYRYRSLLALCFDAVALAHRQSLRPSWFRIPIPLLSLPMPSLASPRPRNPPPPYEQLLPLPTPCFNMFLEESLNDPPPPHVKHPSLLPPLHPPPLPLTILIIHEPETIAFSINLKRHIVSSNCSKIR